MIEENYSELASKNEFKEREIKEFFVMELLNQKVALQRQMNELNEDTG